MKKTLLSFILLTGVSVASFAQCTITYAGAFTQVVQTGYVAGQSFTTTCAGNISSIEVPAASTGTNAAGTLNIYAGNGTSTTPIYTQAVGAITITNVGDPIAVTITGTVPVTNSSQYTFAMDMDLDVYASSGYTGGDAFNAGTNVNPIDVDFEVNITATTGIDEVTNSTTAVYPNPATNVLNITSNEQIKVINFYAINGVLVKTTTQKNIDISGLDSGLYIVSVQTNNGVTQTKLIKE